MEPVELSPDTPPVKANMPIQTRILLTAFIVIVAAVVTPPIFMWRTREMAQALSLSHLHRLSYDLQLYAQDYDGGLPQPIDSRACIDWTTRLRGYNIHKSTLINPSNHSDVPIHDPLDACQVHSGYALNERFYGYFAKGPFPLYNLEIPEQTALLVEAGPMWNRTGRHGDAGVKSSHYGMFAYTDTEDRVSNLVPFPSTHNGRLAIVAADGHALSVRVMHYSKKDGPHNRIYGRIGNDIYDWNGGRMNGHTESPPQE